MRQLTMQPSASNCQTQKLEIATSLPLQNWSFAIQGHETCKSICLNRQFLTTHFQLQDDFWVASKEELCTA